MNLVNIIITHCTTEDHVEQLQSISTPYREEAEGRSSSDMLAEALKVDMEPVMEQLVTRETSPVLPPSAGDATLLPIVQAQRER